MEMIDGYIEIQLVLAQRYIHAKVEVDTVRALRFLGDSVYYARRAINSKLGPRYEMALPRPFESPLDQLMRDIPYIESIAICECYRQDIPF